MHDTIEATTAHETAPSDPFPAGSIEVHPLTVPIGAELRGVNLAEAVHNLFTARSPPVHIGPLLWVALAATSTTPHG